MTVEFACVPMTQSTTIFGYTGFSSVRLLGTPKAPNALETPETPGEAGEVLAQVIFLAGYETHFRKMRHSSCYFIYRAEPHLLIRRQGKVTTGEVSSCLTTIPPPCAVAEPPRRPGFRAHCVKNGIKQGRP